MDLHYDKYMYSPLCILVSHKGVQHNSLPGTGANGWIMSVSTLSINNSSTVTEHSNVLYLGPLPTYDCFQGEHEMLLMYQ